MSRISNRIIKIPPEVIVNQEIKDRQTFFFLTGPKGKSCELKIHPEVKIQFKKETRELLTSSESIKNTALVGTYNSLINGMIDGVCKGFKQQLEIRGVGYKVEMKEQKLIFSLGKSHPIFLDVPNNLNVKAIPEQKKIIIEGINKQEVTSFAAKIRLIKKPGAYHNKGIYYFEEVVKLKPTKSASKTK